MDASTSAQPPAHASRAATTVQASAGTAPSAAVPARLARRLAWAGALALAVALGCGRFLLTPLLPLMQRQLGIDLATAGQLAAATNLGYLFGALSCAFLPVAPRRLILFSVSAVAVLSIGMGLSGAESLWLGLRLLTGIVSGWAVVHLSALITPVLARWGHARYDGLFYAGTGMGILLSGALVPQIAHAGVSAARLWIGGGVLSALALLYIVPALRLSAVQHRPQATTTAVPAPAAAGGALSLTLSYGLTGFGYAIPATFLPIIARQWLSSPALADALWPLYGLASVIVTILIPRLRIAADGQRRALALCQLTMTLGTGWCLLQRNAFGIAGAAVLNGAVLMAVVMFTMREAHRIAPQHTARLAAWLTGAFGAGQILAPLAAGYIANRSGHFESPLAVALLAGLAAAALSLWPQRRHDTPAPAGPHA